LVFPDARTVPGMLARGRFGREPHHREAPMLALISMETNGLDGSVCSFGGRGSDSTASGV
jgi:hypothetical protein